MEKRKWISDSKFLQVQLEKLPQHKEVYPPRRQGFEDRKWHDESGDPAENIYIIMALQHDYFLLHGFTNHQGYILFENVFSGNYNYSIWLDDFLNITDSLTIIDQSVSITHYLVKPEVWFVLPENELTYYVGQDEYIPIAFKLKGFTQLSYSLSTLQNEISCMVKNDLIYPDTLTTITLQLPLNPYTQQGKYYFSLNYFDIPRSQQYLLESKPFTIINNTQKIDSDWPERAGFFIMPGKMLEIRWNSINITKVNIYYSLGNSEEWILIAKNQESLNSICGYAVNNYQWFVPHEIVSETTACRFKIENVDNPSVYSISEIFHFMAPTSVQLNRHSDFKIFPNPANDKVTITFSGSISEISFIDNLGRIILTKSGAFENETELDISFLNPGVYLVRLASVEKTQYLKLQVIQR